MPAKTKTIAALDVGTVRIGVALTLPDLSIAKPFGVIASDEGALDAIAELVEKQQVSELVIGLPRGLDGQDTQQTTYVTDFARKLGDHLGDSVTIHMQDEALTSHKAEQALQTAKKPYQKADIDALAACYILEDYLQEAGN